VTGERKDGKKKREAADSASSFPSSSCRPGRRVEERVPAALLSPSIRGWSMMWGGNQKGKKKVVVAVRGLLLFRKVHWKEG